MTRVRGWAQRGDRLLAKVPHGHWRTLTFLAALRYDRIDAPCVIDGIEQVFAKLKPCHERLLSEQSKPPGGASEFCSSTSPRKNAPTISKMPDMLSPKWIRL